MIAVSMTRREKSAKASAGIQALPAIAKVGWGDGGHNPSTGEVIEPTSDSLQAYGQFIEKSVDLLTVDLNKVLVEVSLAATEGNGRNVSSCALFDAAGDLIVVANFPPKGKDEQTILEIEFTEEH